MELLMKTIIKKILVRIFIVSIRIIKTIKIWQLQINPNIRIEKSVKIDRNTIIETNNGGTIIIGRNSELKENVIIQTYGGSIIIGENCSVNAGTIIYGVSEARIGNNVLIAGGCMIIPTNHVFNDSKLLIREQGLNSKPIIIEDDVWIAHGCTILAGVTIGKGSVVAAGAVVHRSVEPYSVVAGVPAKLIKRRE